MSPVREYLLSLTKPFTIRGACRDSPYPMSAIRHNVDALCNEGAITQVGESASGQYRYLSNGMEGAPAAFSFAALLEAFGNWTVTPDGYEHPKVKRAYVFDWRKV